MKEQIKKEMSNAIGSYSNSLTDSIAERCTEIALKYIEQSRQAAVMPSLLLAVEVLEKYLNENFWIDHTYENGYPTKVIAKADFLGMLNELKLKLANGNGA